MADAGSPGRGRPGTRPGSPAKRAAILEAARHLFVDDGFERTSMDAVAARANASKRTVYDYFGDKDGLLLAVVDDLAERVMAIVQRAQDRLDASGDLEESLVGFATIIAESVVGSPDYAGLLRLVVVEQRHVPELREHWMNFAPEDLLVAKLEELAGRGLLALPDSRIAADHLVALTLGGPVPFSFASSSRSDDIAYRRRRAEEGVRVFLAAYGAEAPAPPSARAGRAARPT